MTRSLTVAMLGIALLAQTVARAQTDAPAPEKSKMVTIGEKEFFLMEPLAMQPGVQYPVVLAFHGSGGDHMLPFVKFFQKPLREQYPCYILSATKGRTGQEVYPDVVKYVSSLKQVDLDRIYIQGYSMGSGNLRSFVTRHPEFFAAASASAGSGLLGRGESAAESAAESGFEKFRDLPFWAFHGRSDDRVKIDGVLKFYEAMKKIDGNTKLTIFEDKGHGIARYYFHYDGSDPYDPPAEKDGPTKVTNMSVRGEADSKSGFLDWLFAQSRKNKPSVAGD